MCDAGRSTRTLALGSDKNCMKEIAEKEVHRKKNLFWPQPKKMNRVTLLKKSRVRRALKKLSVTERESVIATMNLMDPNLSDAVEKIVKLCCISKDWSLA